MTVALCMFALWAWGGWISWKGIENGNGWIGVILFRENTQKSEQKRKLVEKGASFGGIRLCCNGCKGDRVDPYFCHAHGGRLAF